MNFKFFFSNIYRLAATAVSALWLFVGTNAYISAFGWYNTWQEMRETLPALLSWWFFLCYKMGVTVFTQHAATIDAVTILKSLGSGTYTPEKFEISFNLAGYLTYITVPVLCIWALLYGYKWLKDADI